MGRQNHYVLILFLLSFKFGLAQNSETLTNRKTRLLNEIKQSNQIESYYLGFAGTVSTLCLKVDSLLQVSSLNEIVSYYDDTSYIIKYYTFRYLVSEYDSLALEKLENGIADSTNVFTHENCVWSNKKFNDLMVEDYSRFIRFKYSVGGVINFDGKTYTYAKRNKKQWRKKRKELAHLLRKNHIKEPVS